MSGEIPGPDPSMHGGQTNDPGSDADLDAAIIAAAKAEVDLADAAAAPVETEIDPTQARHQEMLRNLHTIWAQADALALTDHPDAQLMYSGVTTASDRTGKVSPRMVRSFDIYQKPDGGVVAFMGKFLPGTEDARPVPCDVMAFSQPDEATGDYQIWLRTPLVFDAEGRQLDVILQVATELPRALANPNRGTVSTIKNRTKLQAVSRNDKLGIFNVANPVPSSLLPPRWKRKPIIPRQPARVRTEELLVDLKMVEARDMQIQLGEDPPYRKGFMNVGAADRKR